jgi:hypothetical protein
MWSGCSCVLGQVTGGFLKTVHRLWPKTDLGLALKNAAAHGFALTETEPQSTWRQIEDAWLAEIESRCIPDVTQSQVS